MTANKLSGRVNPDKCEFCGNTTNDKGDDFCIGHLDQRVVMNACCGHGNDSLAYVQFWNGDCIRGNQAVVKINQLKGEGK